MMSRLALRTAVSRACSRANGAMIIRAVPTVQAAPALQLICGKTFSVSSVLDGKNIYYGFSKEENQKPNSPVHRFYVFFLPAVLILVMFKGADFLEWLDMDVGARELDVTDDKDQFIASGSGAAESDVMETRRKKKKTTFREKKIIEYENRIRNYSTPDKIFRYFATLKVKKEGEQGGYEIYMTPEDFVRSLMPGVMQPEDLGLDKFRKFDPDGSQLKLREDSIFYCLETHGLISFSDYILLLTLLSTPSKQFELAFKMFDNNGDGNLDMEEYERVQAIIRSRTTVGQRHRDHSNTGNVIRSDPNGALRKYFFGESLNQKLSYQKFIQFHKALHDEILWIEFNQVSDDGESISERDFANQILLYADFSDQKRVSICRRVRREFRDESKGVSFKEYYDFAQVLKNINEIDTALTFYHVAGAAIDKQTLKHVARTVAKVNLTDHLVNVVFAIFDENDDEKLSNKEFVAVMKRRLMRGLERPRETGFAKLFDAVGACARSMMAEQLARVRNKPTD